MPQIFWFNLIALFFTTVAATALLLLVLGSGLKRPINLSFALFSFTVSASAIFNILRHLSLWLEVGNALLLTELALLAGLLMGPFLFMFVVFYLDRRSRWTDWAIGVGLAIIVVACVPLFMHQMSQNPHLDIHGIAQADANLWLILVANLSTIYSIWAFVLFWQERHKTDIYVGMGIVIFWAGFFLNAMLRPPFPIISVSTAVSVMVLGYGVARLQLFNPLKEFTDELQQKIAEREQAEESLREERNILRTLIDNLPDQIYVKDAASRFVISNAAHLRTIGAETRDDVAGKTDLDIFPAEMATQFYEDEQKIIASGQPLINREEQVEDQSTGEMLWYLTTKVPVQDNRGQVTALVGMSRNITPQKQAEQEREHLQQQIIEAQQQTLQELSTPIIPVMDNIIIIPLVGSIDSMRARDITRSLLAGIGRHNAKVVIIDITGVSMVDTDVVSHLNRTIQAAKLKGASTIVTGISDIVAETIVDLGLDWSGITTVSNLQRGLVIALRILGVEMRKSG